MTFFKDRLANTTECFSGHIVTIPSAVAAQALASAGADYLIIDLEHGAVDYGSAHAMIAATKGFPCAPLVRVAINADHHVKRALDLGAEGVVFPLIETAADVERAVASLAFPPAGRRGFGPFIAHSLEGVSLPDYAGAIDGSRTCCILAETKLAVENIAEICAVPGIDILVPAPFDLSTAMGAPGDFTNPAFIAAMAKIETHAQAAGIPMAGVARTAQEAAALFDRGYRMIVGFDVLLLKAAAGQLASWCKQ